MYEDVTKKVIRASAGTGKTFRLSLEYIYLLIKYKDLKIDFSEIVVITFTNKAAAEIRERIFKHLNDLTSGTVEQQRELISILENLFNLKIGDETLRYLTKVYENIRINQEKVRISTIDSFTNYIFKSMIAPYCLNIDNYEISTAGESAYLSELYEYIFSNSEVLSKSKDLFLGKGSKTLEQYDKLIDSLIRNRWLLHFFEKHKFLDEEKRQNLIQQYEQNLNRTISSFWDFVCKYQKDISFTKFSDLIKTDFLNLISENKELLDSRDFDNIEEIKKIFFMKFTSNNFYEKEYKVFLKKINNFFWDGNKFKKKHLKDEMEQTKVEMIETISALIAFLYETKVKIENNMILELTDLIYKQIDDLKVKFRKFSHSDITFYTYNYLYDENISIIDKELNSVQNIFYEFLTYRIRFLLIDEFQDTSVIQFKILSPIISELISGSTAKGYGGYVVVGDEKQSIYGWRGGERRLFRVLEKDIGSESLNTSYRSNLTIMNFVNDLFNSTRLNSFFKSHSISWNCPIVEPVNKNLDGFVKVVFIDKKELEDQKNVFKVIAQEILEPLSEKNVLIPENTAFLAYSNDDIADMSEALEEHTSIKFVKESSYTVLSHKAVRPVYSLLKFLVYRHISDYLEFLRSDVVLINGNQLKKIVISYLSEEVISHVSVFEKIALENSEIEALKIVNEIDKVKDEENVICLVKMILEKFNFINIFNSENDIKNLNYFMNIISDFMTQLRNSDRGLAALLKYLEEESDNQDFKQQSLRDLEAVQLLTIHKAKGLQFENVIVYIDLSAKEKNEHGNLNLYYEFDDDFVDINDFMVTYNYNKIYKMYQQQIGQEGLCAKKIKKDVVEKLNSAYVAFTRAKKNLIVVYGFNKPSNSQIPKDDGELKTTNLHKVLAESVKPEDSVFYNTDFNFLSICEEYTTVEKKRGETKEKIAADLSFLLNPKRTAFLQTEIKDQQLLNMNYHTVFIENKNILIGNFIHYYLSFIKYNSNQEKQIAYKKTLLLYGNKLNEMQLKKLFELAESIPVKYSRLFDKKWDKVFNEYTVFFNNNNYRIDRLMVNTGAKEILIADYKTGEAEDEQLKLYNRIIKEHPVIQAEQYNVQYEIIYLNDLFDQSFLRTSL